MLDPGNVDVVTMDMIFKHIDYMVKLVGPDHVGYGSDYIPDITQTAMAVQIPAYAWIFPDNGYTIAAGKKGMPTPKPPEMIAALVDKMLEHGYSEKDCGKIIGGNLMRVFEEVWF
jgi:membrane dipeptidase